MFADTDQFIRTTWTAASDSLFAHRTISDYQRLAATLPYLEPADSCCEAAWMTPISIEPIDERNLEHLDERSCIVQCSSCGRLFVSWC
jgi:hypothetical protein